jgi:hypothetical protein
MRNDAFDFSDHKVYFEVKEDEDGDCTAPVSYLGNVN